VSLPPASGSALSHTDTLPKRQPESNAGNLIVYAAALLIVFARDTKLSAVSLFPTFISPHLAMSHQHLSSKTLPICVYHKTGGMSNGVPKPPSRSMFIVLVKRVATLTRCHDYNVVRPIQSSKTGGTRFGSYFQCKDRSKSFNALVGERAVCHGSHADLRQLSPRSDNPQGRCEGPDR
jgi:hypothetical protein